MSFYFTWYHDVVLNSFLIGNVIENIWSGIIGLAMLHKLGCGKDRQKMTGYWRCAQLRLNVHIIDSSTEASVMLGNLEKPM